MTEYETFRKAHSLDDESDCDSDSGSDTDSENFSQLRPPPYNYEEVKHNIVVVEPAMTAIDIQNAGEDSPITVLSKKGTKGKKRKRWLPLTTEVIQKLDTKVATNLAETEKIPNSRKSSMQSSVSSGANMHCFNNQQETEDISKHTNGHVEETSEHTKDPSNNSTFQKFQNAWGNLAYRQKQEENASPISDKIKNIWTNDSEKQTSNNGTLHYIENVWDSLVYGSSEVPSVQQDFEKNDFVSYFSDDLDEKNNVLLECAEKENKLEENAPNENFSNCLTSIQEIMPENLLKSEIITEFKYFLIRFSNLDKTQQNIFLTSLNFESILSESPLALCSLKIFNSTALELLKFNSKVESNDTKTHQNNDDDKVENIVESMTSHEPQTPDKIEISQTPPILKVSPSKSTNIVKPYNFIKAEKTVSKVKNKKVVRKIMTNTKQKTPNKERAKIKPDITNDKSVIEKVDSPAKSDQNSLDEQEIAEIERTLNELEIDDSGSESDSEFYEKTVKTVSFVFLLSKIMYIVLLAPSCRAIVSFLNYFESWQFIKKWYIRVISKRVDTKIKHYKKKIIEFYKTHLRIIINTIFCKAFFIALATFYLFSQIESIQPIVSWIYVLVFNILPLAVTIYELGFLKPLCWFHDTVFKGTVFHRSSHLGKFVFCCIAIYYVYKITMLICKVTTFIFRGTTLIFKAIKIFTVRHSRRVQGYASSGFQFATDSLNVFQNQTFNARKDRKDRTSKSYKMRQIRKRN